MSLYEILKENADEVLFVDRTGNLISVYCKDNVKVQFQYATIGQATFNYTKFRRELEGIKI